MSHRPTGADARRRTGSDQADIALNSAPDDAIHRSHDHAIDADSVVADTRLNARIQGDIAALRAACHQGLETQEGTAEALANHQQNNLRRRIHIMNKPKKRWLLAVAVGLLAATGVVFAATQTDLISIWVDTEGKTDQAVEQEIHDQLINSGVTAPVVTFERDGDESNLDISGTKGDREFRIVRKKIGDGPDPDDGVVAVDVPAFDTTREPGMTDEQLRAKIQAQLTALGLDGEVTVTGDEIRVEAHHGVEICDDESGNQVPCPPGAGPGNDD